MTLDQHIAELRAELDGAILTRSERAAARSELEAALAEQARRSEAEKACAEPARAAA